MKIGIDYLGHSASSQMFDSLYAFKQSQSPGTNYSIDLIIDESSANDADIKILFCYLPETLENKNPQDYDFVFLCNNSESLDVSTQLMFDLYHGYPNVYLVSNSYLHHTHPLYGRVIWYCLNIPLCRDYWNRPFYPQFYEHQTKSASIARQNKITIINGQNRAWRHHAIQEIIKNSPGISVKSSITRDNIINEILDCIWESDQDRAFRDETNSAYPISRNCETDYYSNSIVTGINEKFGSIPPGYFILDEYYENLVTVFTERSWLNNELSITEKGLKCFMAGSIPFPIGGSNIHMLYNQLGFYTAWNLLPDSLKVFDCMTNHLERYEHMSRAVAWLIDNLDDLDQQEINQMVDHNRFKFLSGGNGLDLSMLCKLFKI